MEFFQYIRIVRRWLWLLLLMGIVGGSISFITQTTRPDIYRAQTLIAIGGFLQSPNPNSQEIRIGVELAETYAQIVRTQDVLETAVDNSGVLITPNRLDQLLATRILPNTSILQLTITYTDPVAAADLVNEVALQLIQASPSGLTVAQQAQVDILNEQISSLILETDALREELININSQLEENVQLTSIQREELEGQRTTRIDQINQATSNIAQFTNTVASFQQRTNSVEIIESATIPDQPIGSNIITSTIAGVIVAIFVCFALIMIYEYLNDAFYTTEEVAQSVPAPLLGSISFYGNKNDTYHEKLLINQFQSRIIDEYRILRTNLWFSSNENHGIYIVTSSAPKEGKTTTTANLSISLAKSGLRVLLIDADLRRPRIHELFELDNTIGLTNLFTRDVPISHDGDGGDFSSWTEVVKDSGVENLTIMSSGYGVENPTELLGSTLMLGWINYIQRSQQFDIILIDTPPSLGFPDSSVLANSLGAKMILIIRAGKTRRDLTLRLIERFSQIKVDIAGVVLNQVNPRDENMYGYDYTLYYAD